jgi:hypothetical protein
MVHEDFQELAMFFGPATPSQFDNLLLWRKKRRAGLSAVPDVPEPRREDDEPALDSLDLYALSVGRASVR